MPITAVESEDLAESKASILKGRLFLWLLLIPLTLAAMAAPFWVAAIYALLWVLAASIEFARLYVKPFKIEHILFLVAPLLIWFSTLGIFSFSISLYLMLAILLQSFLWLLLLPDKPQMILPLLVLPLYLGFLPSHFVLLKQESIIKAHSYLWLIFPFVIVWLSDTFAYLAGSLFGKTPLCPKVSPKKTVEGFLAGVVVSIIIGAGFWALFRQDEPWWWWVVLALAVALAGVIGDLIESAIKRERGVKNTSEILGGHGGFLDRLDSIIFGAAAFYYLYPLLSGQ